MKNIVFFLLLSICCILIATFLGPGEINLFHLIPTIKSPGVERTILLQIRLPRVGAGFLVGAGLSLAGAVLQSLLRNPLAEGYTLGLSGGASLGICLGIILQQGFLLPVFAFSGAMASMAIVLSISQRHHFSGATLVLLGVVLNFIFSAFVLLLLAVCRNERFYQAFFWLVGDLSSFPELSLKITGPVILLVAIYLVINAKVLDAMSLGEEKAASLGISLKQTRQRLITASSLLVGCSVAVCGVIGFVGLVIPHLVRIFVGATHRRVIPGCFFLGGCFLVLADGLARILISPLEIPVGVITGFFGGLFFLTLLTSQRGVRVW